MRCQGFYSPGLEEPKGCLVRETEINELTYLSRHIAPFPHGLIKTISLVKIITLFSPTLQSIPGEKSLASRTQSFYSFPSKARGIMLRIVIVQKKRLLKPFSGVSNGQHLVKNRPATKFQPVLHFKYIYLPKVSCKIDSANFRYFTIF